MSYISGAPWRDSDECPNCGSDQTITGKSGWLLDCAGCGGTFTPDRHPDWVKIIKAAVNEGVRVAHQETLRRAARILDEAAALKLHRRLHMQAKTLKEEADLLRLLAEK